MRRSWPYPWARSAWKQALDRLAVAWIVLAPVVALAAAWAPGSDDIPTGRAALGADTMTPPPIRTAVLASNAREEQVDGFRPTLGEDSRDDRRP